MSHPPFNSVESTLSYYHINSHDFAENTFHVDMSDLYLPFLQVLPNEKCRILDVGCGSGRDAIYFANLGHQVIGIDGSQPLIDWSRHRDTRGLVHWQCLTFDELAKVSEQDKFDAIWACASLLHVSYDELSIIMSDLADVLHQNGILYASFKYGDSERYDNGRFFCDMNKNRWFELMKHVNLSTTKIWQTTDNRPQYTQIWFNALMRK